MEMQTIFQSPSMLFSNYHLYLLIAIAIIYRYHKFHSKPSVLLLLLFHYQYYYILLLLLLLLLSLLLLISLLSLLSFINLEWTRESLG